MKPVLTTLKFLTVIALGVFALSCANETQEKQNLAVAAGFQIITPKTAQQETILKQLEPGKVTRVVYQGKTYYVLPDVPNNQAYVGGADQLQAFEQLRLANKLSNENLEAAQMNSMNQRWGTWNSWGGWRGAGWGWR